MIKLTSDKKKKTCSVKDIFNKKGEEDKKEEINFKAIDLNNENDIYIWSEHWRRKRFEK